MISRDEALALLAENHVQAGLLTLHCFRGRHAGPGP